MDIRKWLKDNLINCFRSGRFAKEQVAVYAMNHLVKGNLTEEDVVEIAQAIEPVEEELIAN